LRSPRSWEEARTKLGSDKRRTNTTSLGRKHTPVSPIVFKKTLCFAFISAASCFPRPSARKDLALHQCHLQPRWLRPALTARSPVQGQLCRTSPSTRLAGASSNPQTALWPTCCLLQHCGVYARGPRVSSKAPQSAAPRRLSNATQLHAALLGRKNAAEKRLQALQPGLSDGFSFSASASRCVPTSDSRKQLHGAATPPAPNKHLPASTTLQRH